MWILILFSLQIFAGDPNLESGSQGGLSGDPIIDGKKTSNLLSVVEALEKSGNVSADDINGIKKGLKQKSQKPERRKNVRLLDKTQTSEEIKPVVSKGKK